MKLKDLFKGLCMFLAVPLLVGTIAAAEPSTEEMVPLPEFNQLIGTVTEINENMVTVATSDAIGDVILSTGNSTVILDNTTATPIAVEDIKTGTAVYAWHSPIMTMSLPPMTPARVIVANVAADQRAGLLVEVASVEADKDGTITVVDSLNEKVTFTANADTQITPYLTRQIVRIEDIMKGSQLVVWQNEKGNADKIILFNEGFFDEKEAIPTVPEISTNPNKPMEFTLNGDTVVTLSEKESIYTENGIVMVPLRKIAEALGYEVAYDEATDSVTIFSADQPDTILGTVINGENDNVITEDGYTFVSHTFLMNVIPVIFTDNIAE